MCNSATNAGALSHGHSHQCPQDQAGHGGGMARRQAVTQVLWQFFFVTEYLCVAQVYVYLKAPDP